MNSYYLKNLSDILNYKRMYRTDNLEMMLERERLNRIKFKEKRNAYCLNYYYSHQEDLKAKGRDYYQKNKERIKARMNAYRQRKRLESLS